MNRPIIVTRRIVAGLFLTAVCGNLWAAQAAGTAYEVRKGERLVLTFTDRPGPVTSTALLPPGAAPVEQSFITADARAPEEEDKLRRILDGSKNVQDFIARLRQAGYVVTSAGSGGSIPGH